MNTAREWLRKTFFSLVPFGFALLMAMALAEVHELPDDEILSKLTLHAKPGLIVDFLVDAPKAQWSNAYEKLKFPGNPSSSKGFALYRDNVRLEDNKVYHRALQTHPRWKPGGMIVGRYSGITIPNAGAEFRAIIGFMKGATASDGVYFEIWADFPGYSGIPLRREYHKKYGNYLITDFTQDLSRFSGMTGTIALVVSAGGHSAAQDWAVWVNPQLISLENEYKFASFVGGAVGSGQSGSQLLNPWGGKSGYLYGDITLHLAFANIDANIPVRIDSYYEGQSMGATNLGTVGSGQTEIWRTLHRTQEGQWREEVVFGNTYVGDLRYIISSVGE